MSGLGVVQERQQDALVVVVQGELDISTGPRFEQEASDLDGSRIVLDLALLEFVDSSGLRLIVGVAKRVGDGFAIVCPPDNHPVRRMLEFFGVHEAYPIHGTREEAGLR